MQRTKAPFAHTPDYHLTLTRLLSMLVGLCRPCCWPPAAPPFSPTADACRCCMPAAAPAGALSATLAGSESSEPVMTWGPRAKTCTVPLSLLQASQSQCFEKTMLCMWAGSVPRRSSCSNRTARKARREGDHLEGFRTQRRQARSPNGGGYLLQHLQHVHYVWSKTTTSPQETSMSMTSVCMTHAALTLLASCCKSFPAGRPAVCLTCSSCPSAVFHTRTSVPLSLAVASRLPSNDSVRHTSGVLCALMNLVCLRSYSSMRTCREHSVAWRVHVHPEQAQRETHKHTHLSHTEREGGGPTEGKRQRGRTGIVRKLLCIPFGS